MKILYIDLLSPKGHENFNKILIKILSKIAFVDIAWKEGYLEGGSVYKMGKKFFPIPIYYFKYKSKLDYRVKNYYKILWILKKIDIKSYDLVLVSSYETVSFAMAWPRTIRSRVVLFNHNNIDELGNFFKRFLFKKIPRYIEHIVFEEFIKRYIIEKIKIQNPIWTIHYPLISDEVLVNYKILQNNMNEAITLDCNLVFAPSGSNDEKFIFNVIKFQKEKNFLNSTMFKLIIKSKKWEYRDDHLIVIRKYFNNEEYLTYLSNATIVLLPYPNGFRYRISGVLFDAFTFKKKILASSNPIFRYFVRRYPGIGRLFNDINEFIEIIYFFNEYIKDNGYQNDELFEKIHKVYSFETTKEDLQKILKGR